MGYIQLRAVIFKNNNWNIIIDKWDVLADLIWIKSGKYLNVNQTTSKRRRWFWWWVTTRAEC